MTTQHPYTEKLKDAIAATTLETSCFLPLRVQRATGVRGVVRWAVQHRTGATPWSEL